MKKLVSELFVAIAATILLAVLLCGIYPIAVWGISQVLFPYQANGSFIEKNGKIVGSELIAQNFTDPKYFHPRPSNAGEAGYDGASSGGSNLGPLSEKLQDSVKKRIEAYRSENGLSAVIPVPVDAVTASGSGLDPHISLADAALQAGRVARERHIGEESVKRIIQACTTDRDLGILGEKRVNVLRLNLALDGIQ